MTLKQFFERLPKDGWWMTSDGLIRRGADRILPNRCECPITSIRGREALFFLREGNRLGMDYDLVCRIAEAADNETHTPTLRRIRRLLLNHCGLAEVAK